jgi:hypothetical protein
MLVPPAGVAPPSTALVQQAWTTRAIRIVEDLYGEAFLAAGGPPCAFAFGISGSGARQEACPYSDLDCFIVLDPTAGAAQVTAMVAISQTVRDRLAHINWDRDVAAANAGVPNKGFTFCAGGLNPGGWGGAGPVLTGTAVDLAALIETNLGAANAALAHVGSGLQESSFGFGTVALRWSRRSASIRAKSPAPARPQASRSVGLSLNNQVSNHASR